LVGLEGVLFLFSRFLGVAGFEIRNGFLEYIFSVVLSALGILEVLLFEFGEILLGDDLTGDGFGDGIGDGFGDILLVGELLVIFNELLEFRAEALDFLVGRVDWLTLVFGEDPFDELFLMETDFLIFNVFQGKQINISRVTKNS